MKFTYSELEFLLLAIHDRKSEVHDRGGKLPDGTVIADEHDPALAAGLEKIEEFGDRIEAELKAMEDRGENA